MAKKYGTGDFHRICVKRTNYVDRVLEYKNLPPNEKAKMKRKLNRGKSNYQCEVCGVNTLSENQAKYFYYEYKRKNKPFRLVCYNCSKAGFVAGLPSFKMKPKINERRKQEELAKKELRIKEWEMNKNSEKNNMVAEAHKEMMTTENADRRKKELYSKIENYYYDFLLDGYDKDNNKIVVYSLKGGGVSFTGEHLEWKGKTLIRDYSLLPIEIKEQIIDKLRDEKKLEKANNLAQIIL